MNRFSPRIVAASLGLLVMLGLGGTAGAHEGDDHGTPAPVVVAAGETLMSAYATGTAFDAVMKYKPFAKGEVVDVTVYLVASDTNRPVAGATITASLSAGADSREVVFLPKAGGPVGAYAATVTASSDAPISLLLDVTAGETADLIAVDGLAPSDPASVHEHESADGHADEDFAPPPIAVMISLGTLLLIGAFAAGRLTAGKEVAA